MLSRVAAGEELEITRNGAPVAVLAPVRSRLLSSSRYRALLEAAPPIDDGFADDLREIRKSADAPEGSWPS
jgi:prevent-host-death family protein